MKFSIIIPVYNEEKYIKHLLTSLAKQDFKDFEVIVIDDNSTDQTLNKIKTINKNLDLNLRMFQSKKHLGISRARNLGASKAKADLLVFFDADGYVPSNWLNITRDHLENHQGIKAISGISLFTSKSFSKRTLYNLHGSISYVFVVFFQSIFGNANYLTGNNLAIRKKVFFEAGKFPDLIAEDVFLTQSLRSKYSKRDSLKLLPRLKVYYSPRRFEKHGYVKTIWEWIKASVLQKRPHRNYKIYR